MNYDAITGQKMKKYKLFLILIGLCLIGASIFLVSISSAFAIIPQAGSNYIKWNWVDDDNAISQISIDGGVKIYNNLTYNGTLQYFILSDLEPNTIHSIQIKDDITDTIFSTNITNTTSLSENETNQEQFFAFVMIWIVFIFGVVFCAIGLYGVPFASLIGSVMGVIGLVSHITNGSFIMDVLYAVLIIAGILLVRGEI